jgi:CheY-like chemotaxis protein
MFLVIADDDRDSAESLSELLQVSLEEPPIVLVAFDGHEAVAAVTGPNRPDVVIMDIEMPGMSGFDAATAIRAALGVAQP